MNDAIDGGPGKTPQAADPGVLAIIEARPLDARVERAGGQWVLTMVRPLSFAPERVWRKLTEPAELAKWSPIVPDRPLTAPGPARARETPTGPDFDAEVLVADQPHELVHRWGNQLLRWTIEPAADGCVLTLAHSFGDLAERTSYAAGWHIVLAVLEADLAGRAPERVVGERAKAYAWSSLAERYAGTLDR